MSDAKRMSQLFGKCLNALLAVLLAGLAIGCDTIQQHSLTCVLWNDSSSYSHCRPQTHPDLKLFDSEHPSDVLVEYNAVSDQRQGVQRRAYFLNASSRRIAAGKPPRFVDPRRDTGLKSIAVLKSASQTNSLALTNGVFAVAKGNRFTLYRPENSPEFCALPYYQDGGTIGSWKHTALTPFALAVDVVVDVTVIGVVAGFVAAYAYCQGGGTVSP